MNVIFASNPTVANQMLLTTFIFTEAHYEMWNVLQKRPTLFLIRHIIRHNVILKSDHWFPACRLLALTRLAVYLPKSWSTRQFCCNTNLQPSTGVKPYLNLCHMCHKMVRPLHRTCGVFYFYHLGQWYFCQFHWTAQIGCAGPLGVSGQCEVPVMSELINKDHLLRQRGLSVILGWRPVDHAGSCRIPVSFFYSDKTTCRLSLTGDPSTTQAACTFRLCACRLSLDGDPSTTQASYCRTLGEWCSRWQVLFISGPMVISWLAFPTASPDGSGLLSRQRHGDLVHYLARGSSAMAEQPDRWQSYLFQHVFFTSVSYVSAPMISVPANLMSILWHPWPQYRTHVHYFGVVHPTLYPYEGETFEHSHICMTCCASLLHTYMPFLWAENHSFETFCLTWVRSEVDHGHSLLLCRRKCQKFNICET